MIETKITGISDKVFNNLGGYFVGHRQSAAPYIIELADNYSLYKLKKMHTIYPDDINPRNIKKINLRDDLTVTIKVDGMYNLFYYDKNTTPLSIFCNSGYGRARYNLPVNADIENRIEDINKSNLIEDLDKLLYDCNKPNVLRAGNAISSIVLAGELHTRLKREGDRNRIIDIMKFSWNPQTLMDLEKICYEIFDILSINQISLSGLKYEDRIKLINFLFPRKIQKKRPKACVVEYFLNMRENELKPIFEKFVINKRHEGLVITNKSGLVFKLKNRYEIDAIVIGYADSREKFKGRIVIGSLLVALMYDDGTYQVLTSVDSGFSSTQKLELMKLLKPDKISSYYHSNNAVGQPFRFIKPKYVVQIKFLDVLTRDVSSNELKGVTLTCKEGKWVSINNPPFIKLINPHYDIFRGWIDDPSLYSTLQSLNPKSAIFNEVKIDQIFGILNHFVELGDKSAKVVLKGLISKKIKNGSKEILYDLVSEGLLSDQYFSQVELQELMAKIQ